MKTLLLTGGAGFIGSNFVRYILEAEPQFRIVNLDKLTYAGNLDNLADLAGHDRHRFVHGDIADESLVESIFKEGVDSVINFAAETHVDRSISNPSDFIRTDVYGTYVLLEASRSFGVEKFVQISTDEVYGSIESGSFKETDPLMPRNPYSASKAGADRLAYSYWATYNLPVIITRASNNFGPYQYPEKYIPLSVTNLLEEKQIPLYGDGRNVRDWLYVLDHCEALHLVLEKGAHGEVYNISAGNEYENIEIARRILTRLGKDDRSVLRVKDRLGHDRRYSLDASKLRSLGWTPRHSFDDALVSTIDWYVKNSAWWKKIKSGDFKHYYQKQYGPS